MGRIHSGPLSFLAPSYQNCDISLDAQISEIDTSTSPGGQGTCADINRHWYFCFILMYVPCILYSSLLSPTNA